MFKTYYTLRKFLGDVACALFMGFCKWWFSYHQGKPELTSAVIFAVLMAVWFRWTYYWSYKKDLKRTAATSGTNPSV